MEGAIWGAILPDLFLPLPLAWTCGVCSGSMVVSDLAAVVWLISTAMQHSCRTWTLRCLLLVKGRVQRGALWW